jgi:hypothetical protein
MNEKVGKRMIKSVMHIWHLCMHASCTEWKTLRESLIARKLKGQSCKDKDKEHQRVMHPLSHQPLTHLQKMLLTSSLQLPQELHMFLLSASQVAHHDLNIPRSTVRLPHTNISSCF